MLAYMTWGSRRCRSYLANTLGDAPYPQWGVPQGWGNYLAGTLLLRFLKCMLVLELHSVQCTRLCCHERVMFHQKWLPHADLLSWASGLPISKADAMRCARREPGRSWQAIPTELTRLGAYPMPASDQ